MKVYGCFRDDAASATGQHPPRWRDAPGQLPDLPDVDPGVVPGLDPGAVPEPKPEPADPEPAPMLEPRLPELPAALDGAVPPWLPRPCVPWLPWPPWLPWLP